MTLDLKKTHPEGVEFFLPELTKSIRVGKNLKVSFHASFPSDKRLCPCACLKAYEIRTAHLRPQSPEQTNRLFLALVKPHKRVQAATLAHWIRYFLCLAGVDSNIFKAHSTRGAASSAAARAGLSVEDIIKMANWTNDNTFRRFYYKPVHNPTFGLAVLGEKVALN